MIYRIDETTSTNDEARDAADRRTRPAGTYVDQPRR